MNPQRQPRRSASEWSELIARQDASGLSQRDFCDNEGLAVSTFTYWKRKLGSGSATKPRREADRPLFTPIQALPASAEASAEDEPTGSSWSIDLDLGDGLRLTIRKVA
jgi:hypothetical protein